MADIIPKKLPCVGLARSPRPLSGFSVSDPWLVPFPANRYEHMLSRDIPWLQAIREAPAVILRHPALQNVGVLSLVDFGDTSFENTPFPEALPVAFIALFRVSLSEFEGEFGVNECASWDLLEEVVPQKISKELERAIKDAVVGSLLENETVDVRMLIRSFSSAKTLGHAIDLLMSGFERYQDEPFVQRTMITILREPHVWKRLAGLRMLGIFAQGLKVLYADEIEKQDVIPVIAPEPVGDDNEKEDRNSVDELTGIGRYLPVMNMGSSSELLVVLPGSVVHMGFRQVDRPPFFKDGQYAVIRYATSDIGVLVSVKDAGIRDEYTLFSITGLFRVNVKKYFPPSESQNDGAYPTARWDHCEDEKPSDEEFQDEHVQKACERFLLFAQNFAERTGRAENIEEIKKCFQSPKTLGEGIDLCMGKLTIFLAEPHVSQLLLSILSAPNVLQRFDRAMGAMTYGLGILVAGALVSKQNTPKPSGTEGISKNIQTALDKLKKPTK